MTNYNGLWYPLADYDMEEGKCLVKLSRSTGGETTFPL